MPQSMIIFDSIISVIQQTGGASVLFKELMSRLCRDGIPYHDYGFKKENIGKSNYTLLQSRLGERYRRFPVGLIKSLSDHYIFHSTCYRLPTKKSSPIVTTVHDFTYERVIGGLPRVIHSWQKNMAIREADLVICVSESTRRDMLYYLPDMAKKETLVVYNGVSDGFGVLENRRIGNYVLFVGQRVSYKNFKSLVLALAKFGDIHLRCVGGGQFTKNEKEFLDRLIPNRYSHLGYVDEATLNAAYNSAICLVYPSRYEGFGIPVVEAMRAGCPVIAGNNSSIPEVAGGAAILMDRGEPDEIVTAIEKVTQAMVRDRMIGEGILQSKKFSWEVHYKEMLKAYMSLGLECQV